MNNKFDEGTQNTYAELPVPVNYLYWKRGNGQLLHLKETDPGAYYGGWSASIEGRDNEKRPELPLPIVTRVSDDGSATFQRYASNVIRFLPIAYRQRYESRVKSFDKNTGREVEKVAAVTNEYISGVHSGFQPMKQVFGLVYDKNMNFAPCVLWLNKWSSYISFGRAAGLWKKIVVPEGKILVRRFGTMGVSNKQGAVIPNFETVNEGKSTPIEAIGIDKPIFVDVTPELDTLWDQAQLWAKCERWNAQGKIVDESAAHEILSTPEEPPIDDNPF